MYITDLENLFEELTLSRSSTIGGGHGYKKKEKEDGDCGCKGDWGDWDDWDDCKGWKGWKGWKKDDKKPPVDKIKKYAKRHGW